MVRPWNKRRRILGHLNSYVEGRSVSPDKLDSDADAMWAYAADCDRWGLGSDAAEARRKTIEMRVGALLKRSVLPGAGSAGDGEPA